MSRFGRLEVLVHVRRGDEILVLRRSAAKGGYWNTVAGGVEAGEDWRTAALRELQEETGLTPVDVHEIGAYEYVREGWEPQPGMRVDVRAFVADAPAGWEPALDWEHDLYRWCSANEARGLLHFDEPRELLRAV
jgi:8-oxo-dGTP pyrophosphatase MutT (NUDIX family)